MNEHIRSIHLNIKTPSQERKRERKRQLTAEKRKFLGLEPKEKKWSQIFLLMEEEMEHMIRDVVLKPPCMQIQDEWEKEWMEKITRN